MQQQEISACYKIITGRRIPSSFLIRCCAQAKYQESFKSDDTVRQRILAAILRYVKEEPERNILKRIVDDVVERVIHHKNMPFVVQQHLLRHDFTHNIIYMGMEEEGPMEDWSEEDVTFFVQPQYSAKKIKRLCALYTEKPCMIQLIKDKDLKASWIVPRCCAPLIRTYGLTEDLETFGVLRHIYVINLRRRQDRRKRIGAVLGDLHLPFTLFSACDPIEDPYWRDVYSHKQPRLNQGEFGLVQTTLLVLKEAIERGLEYVLLLEDDVVFCKNFRRRFGEAMHRVPLDWNVIYLGAKQYGRTRAETSAAYFYPHNANTTGSHAMLLRKTCLPILLEHFSLHQDRPVDESIKFLFHQRGTIPASTVYVLNSNLVITLCGANDTVSDIQSREKNEEETYSFWGWDVENFALWKQQG
jgi:GR25 family glycosyltransferase involved in LPS biosynthesis